MAVLHINGDRMPSPSKLYVVHWEVKSPEERNAAGLSIVDRVAIKRRLECEWSFVERACLSLLLEKTSAPFFDVQYFDPLDNDLKTITCSVGERTIGALIYRNHLPVWGQVKMTFTER